MTEEESSEQELDSDESEGKDWSDLEREAAESDEERSDNDERSDNVIELGEKSVRFFFLNAEAGLILLSVGTYVTLPMHLPFDCCVQIFAKTKFFSKEHH